MRKIISLLQRNYSTDHLVRDEVVPGAEWVLAGEGVPTVKWDGTAVLYDRSLWYKRYDVKKGRTAPSSFLPAQDPDPETGHWPGWMPVGMGPEDQWLREAITNTPFLRELGGTYEAIGPKIQGNAYGLGRHVLVRHGVAQLVYDVPPRTFMALKDYCEQRPGLEGVVWHHPDGRMVKIKRKDFGFPWPTNT